ncbi:helix-turn-helix domain-containing protein [Sinorhizobium medicae]|nr:helix-turn-helix domain-containing protein [Sinorhizobium medicae]
MALIGYARVSTRDQTVAAQLDALRKVECARIFEEKASGANRDRPQLAAALDYMREGDTLVVWKLDRLARSLKQLTETVETLEDRGIGFRSLTEAIDTTMASGRLVFQIFGALAEFERGVIRERTRAGLDAARSRGRKGGRPPKLKPADLKAAKALLADPEINVEDVARRLGVSPATLYRHIPAARASVSLVG